MKPQIKAIQQWLDPRLGGNECKGVFATRATFRPNAIGMSAVKLKALNIKMVN